MLCLLITLLIGIIHEIDASHDNQDVQPLVEYIRNRRHQIYNVEPNDYFEQKENYPKVLVTQYKTAKHKKQKNKHEKVKNEKIQKRIQKPKPDSETRKKAHKRKKDWVKESFKESNVSESEEKHSPVDIVVHIKMNE